MSTISLTPGPEHHGEEVKCVARVPGLGRDQDRQAMARLTVHYIGGAKITQGKKLGQSRPVKQGEEVNVDCNVEANPPPYQVVWEQDVSTL